jgi:hypothetical protein
MAECGKIREACDSFESSDLAQSKIDYEDDDEDDYSEEDE